MRILRAKISRESLPVSLDLAHVERFHLTCHVSCGEVGESGSGSGVRSVGKKEASSEAKRLPGCHGGAVYEWSDGMFSFVARGETAVDVLDVLRVRLRHRETEIGQVCLRLTDALVGRMDKGAWVHVGDAARVFLKVSVQEGPPKESIGSISISQVQWAKVRDSSLEKEIASRVSKKMVDDWLSQCLGAGKKNSKFEGEIDEARVVNIQKTFRGFAARREIYAALSRSSGVVQVELKEVTGLQFGQLQRIVAKVLLQPSAASQESMPAWGAQGRCRFSKQLLQLPFHALGEKPTKLRITIQVDVLEALNDQVIGSAKVNCTSALLRPEVWHEHLLQCTPRGTLSLRVFFLPHPVNNTRSSKLGSPAIQLTTTFLPAIPQKEQQSAPKALNSKTVVAIKLIQRNSYEALETLLEDVGENNFVDKWDAEGHDLLAAAVHANSVESADVLLKKGYQWLGSPPPRSIRMAKCLGIIPASSLLVTTESQLEGMKQVCIPSQASPGKKLLLQLLLAFSADYDSPAEVVEELVQVCTGINGEVTCESIISAAEKKKIECSIADGRSVIEDIAQESSCTASTLAQHVEAHFSKDLLQSLLKLSRWEAHRLGATSSSAYCKKSQVSNVVHEIDWDVLVKENANLVKGRAIIYSTDAEVLLLKEASLPVLVNDVLLVRCRKGEEAFNKLQKKLSALRYSHKVAAWQIQAAYRAHVVKPLHKRFQAQRAAARLIQQSVRRRWEQRNTAFSRTELTKTNDAARRIQHFLRKTAKLRLTLKEESAKCIQSNFRKMLSRRRCNKSAIDLADNLSLASHLCQGVAYAVVGKVYDVWHQSIRMKTVLSPAGNNPLFGVSITAEGMILPSKKDISGAVNRAVQAFGIEEVAEVTRAEELLSLLCQGIITGDQEVQNGAIEDFATAVIEHGASSSARKVWKKLREEVEQVAVKALQR